MTMPILVGTDGTRRMGKSLGNYIGVAESAENQFGKIMSIPDEPMRQYFTLLTELPLADVDRLLAPGVNPRDAKELLGKPIVDAIPRARSRRTCRRRVPPPRRRNGPRRYSRPSSSPPPSSTPRVAFRPSCCSKSSNLESSTSNARRVIEQGGLNIGPDREAITDPKALVHVTDGLIVRVGKRKIVRVAVRQ